MKYTKPATEKGNKRKLAKDKAKKSNATDSEKLDYIMENQERIIQLLESR